MNPLRIRLTNRLFHSFLLGSCVVLASSSAQADAAQMTLKNITLSTSGLAQFDWQARAESGTTTLTLPVRRNQVDDVLKSLVILDDNGSINSVSLAGQESLKQLFTDLPFTQDDMTHPATLLNALKGQPVSIQGNENAVGRLVSIHKRPTVSSDSGETLTHDYILTLMGEKGLQEITLNNLNTVKFLDPSLNKDLDRALAAIQEQGKQDTRTVKISLSGEMQRPVQLSYVVDAPLWKTAYRIVLPSGNKDKALVQGWAVLENTTGGDWDNINLSLVSGNPVTYRQALYDVYHVDRPSLPVEVFGKVMPRKDGGDFAIEPQMAMDNDGEMASGGRMGMTKAKRAMPPMPVRNMMMADSVMAEAAPVMQEARAMASGSNMALSNETAGQMVFTFPQAISLPSGHSMMVPFVNANLTAEKIYLYQSDVNAQHPLASLKVTNSGKTGLPPGIVTLYSPESGVNNTYIGDAQMPLVNAGDSRMLSFAVDGKTDIKTQNHSTNRTTDISIAAGVMTVTQSYGNTTDYTIKAPTDEDRTVVIEHRKMGGDWKLVSPETTSTDVTETDTHYRIKIAVKAGEQKEIPVTVERIAYQSLQVADINSQTLNHYVQSWQKISPEAKKVFARLFQLRKLVDDFDMQIRNLEQSKQRITENQARIRENLQAVASTSDIAKRYTKQLGDDEDKIENILDSLEDLQEKRTDALKRLKDYISDVRV